MKTILPEKREITNLADIQWLVDRFYDQVQQDELLGPIFHSVIQNQWPQHLQKMYRFWQTVLLDAYTYSGSPFPPHAALPIDAVHFEAWLRIWKQTLHHYFTGEKAAEAQWRAERMAQVFQSKLNYLRQHESNKPPEQ